MSELLEKILSRENMHLAYKKVKSNNGAGGVDGIEIEEIDEHLIENWEEIRDKIRRRRYRPVSYTHLLTRMANSWVL